MNALAKRDARKAKVVEMKFFGGLSVDKTAAALNVSTQTVLRDWSLAKAWLEPANFVPALARPVERASIRFAGGVACK